MPEVLITCLQREKRNRLLALEKGGGGVWHSVGAFGTEEQQ